MKTLLAATAAIAIAALPVQAAPYTLFIYESAAQLALRPGYAPASMAYWQAYDDFGAQLAAAGILRGGSALTTAAPLAQVVAGTVSPASTPYAASPLALGGYFQIDVPTDADAIAWAGKLLLVDGVVEVRAGYPVPGMSI